MKGLDELIAEHPLFGGLDPSYLALLSGCAQNVGFRAGERVFAEGGAADRFWLLRHGRVALSVTSPGRGSLVIETLGADDVLGWSWLVPPYRWHFDAEAIEPTGAVMFDGACMRARLAADPRLGYELFARFMPLVVDRLQATRVRLLDLYGNAGGTA